MIYGFVGLGLMGGSIAKAIKKYEGGTIFALDKNADFLKKAAGEGVIDEGFTTEQSKMMLESCDFVFVCLPPHATVEFLQANKKNFKAGSIVTEISGVKNEIFSTFPLGIENINFIPSHPMAGNEREGFDFSNGDIFFGRNFIILPYKNTNEVALEKFKTLAKSIGFTNLITTDYKTHDHKIAFTSQLCHVIAASLVDCAEDTNITQFGGGSFEDLTRIALINAPLWTELFCSNNDELISHIESFESSLEKIKKQIQSCDKDGLEKTLSSVRVKRAEMKTRGDRK